MSLKLNSSTLYHLSGEAMEKVNGGLTVDVTVERPDAAFTYSLSWGALCSDFSKQIEVTHKEVNTTAECRKLRDEQK